MSVSHTLSLTSASSRGSSAIEENYSVVKRIGSGAFADVKEVKQKNAKKRFAWKQVSLEKDPHCENEAEILSGLKHEGIVEIVDFFSKDGVIDMLLELCTKGSMSQYIDKHYESLPFTPHKVYVPPDSIAVKSAMQQLLNAVKYLHKNCVAHRDIKPCNVLLSSGRQWKLADFNLAGRFQPGGYMADHVGTRPFKAPEVKTKCYTEKCDVYSMGILFINLVTGKHYWQLSEDGETAEAPHTPPPPEDLLDEKTWRGTEFRMQALDFAKEMIQSPEPQRLSAEEALESFWLRGKQNGCCTIN